MSLVRLVKAAARHLANRGADVAICLADQRACSPAAAWQCHIYRSTHSQQLTVDARGNAHPRLIFDALLGYSFWGLVLRLFAQAIVMPMMGAGFFSSNAGGVMAVTARQFWHHLRRIGPYRFRSPNACLDNRLWDSGRPLLPGKPSSPKSRRRPIRR